MTGLSDLETYGVHLPGCHYVNRGAACNCGYREALDVARAGDETGLIREMGEEIIRLRSLDAARAGAGLEVKLLRVAMMAVLSEKTLVTQRDWNVVARAVAHEYAARAASPTSEERT